MTTPTPVDPREVTRDDLLVQRLGRRRPVPAGWLNDRLAALGAEVDDGLDAAVARIAVPA